MSSPYHKNMFCLNLEVPTDTVRALHMKRMTKPASGENDRAYEIFCRIKSILEDAGMWDCIPYLPLMPEGSITEMIAGRTEIIGLRHRLFQYYFKATLLTKDGQEAARQKLRAFPNYFHWVD